MQAKVMDEKHVIRVRRGDGDEELIGILRDADTVCTQTQQGCFLVVEGFESDPRNLWDIPEYGEGHGK